MWSKEKIIELIKMLHSAPTLWDATNKDYSNKTKKFDELTRLATHFKTNVDEISTKIRSIKTQYRREQRKTERKRSGARTTSPDKQWFGYSLCSFLKENNVSKGSRSTIQKSADKNEDISNISSLELEDEDLSESSSENCSSGPSNYESISHRFQKPMINKITRKRQKHDGRMDETYKFMKSIQQNLKEKDDYTIYGENVAIRMRNAKQSNRAVAIAKNQIDNILFKLEMGEFQEDRRNFDYGTPLKKNKT